MYELRSLWRIVDVDYDSGVACDALTGNEKGLFEVSGVLPSTLVLGRSVAKASENGVWLDNTIDFDGVADYEDCAAGKYNLLRPWGAHDASTTGTFLYMLDDNCEPMKDNVYEIANVVNTATWECSNHLYVSRVKDQLEADPCDTENALCESTWRWPKPLQCGRLYVENGINTRGIGAIQYRDPTHGGFTGIYNEHPSTGWFISDCGCEFLPTSDNQCTNSIVKMTITEK